jgi:4-aminobutyrate aminotransferase/(S)-3-amino-2-methylpropionate transaminase
MISNLIPKGLYTFHRGIAVEARGPFLKTQEGETLLDLTSGLGVLPLGHGDPRIWEAISHQAQRLVHQCSHVILHRPYLELCGRISRAVPMEKGAKVFLCNSGAEAVEWAIRVARAATGRPAVVGFHGGYHGRTHLTSTLTGRAKPYRKGGQPLAQDVYHIPFPYCYRCPWGRSREGCAQICREGLERFFLVERPPEEVAAVVVEPIQGEGGVVVPPSGFIPWLGQVCRENGILLIVDEVQTGLGRTGPLFAIEGEGVEPDIMILGKALGGGIPLAAVVGRGEVMDSVPPSGFGSTFGGNPLGCAAGCRLLEILEGGMVPDAPKRIEGLISKRTEIWRAKVEWLGDVRGRGAMWGLELVEDREKKTASPSLARRLVQKCREKGVMVISGGLYRNVVRLLPPLSMSQEEMGLALDKIEEALGEIP